MIHIFSIIGLEALAILLAWLQSLGGVRTDEAKTLLNIPYPHPPLLRWIVNQTEFLPFQEMLWRVLLASMVIQAVWLVWRASVGMKRWPRLLACASWLGSAAVLLQAGTITTAPLIAVFGLFLVSFVLWSEDDSSWRLPGTCVLFLLWLAALFTAYQAVLYFALLVAALLRLRVSRLILVSVVGIPLCLIALSALSNPFSLDRFVDAGTLNVGKSFFQKFADVGSTAMVGGSIVGAIFGLYGMVLKRAWPLALSLLLVAAFIFLSLRSYYAIFFAPLFTGGVLLLLREHPAWWKKMGIAYVLALLFLHPFSPAMAPGPARTVMQRLAQEGVQGEVSIAGSFGHEWQYESAFPIRKYRSGFLDGAGAVVCLNPCDGLGDSWRKLDGVPVDVWVRK